MRPFWTLTKLELNRLARTWPGLRDAWQEAQSSVGRRDVRGMRYWVFALGWVAAMQYYRRDIAQTGENLARYAEACGSAWAIRAGLDEVLE